MTKWDVVHAKDLPILALSKDMLWHTKSYSTNLWLYKNKNKVKLNYLFKIKDNMTSPNGAFDYVIFRFIAENRFETSRHNFR